MFRTLAFPFFRVCHSLNNTSLSANNLLSYIVGVRSYRYTYFDTWFNAQCDEKALKTPLGKRKNENYSPDTPLIRIGGAESKTSAAG